MEIFFSVMVIQNCIPVKIRSTIPQKTILLYGNLKKIKDYLKFKNCLDCILWKYSWVWVMLLWFFQSSDLQPFLWNLPYYKYELLFSFLNHLSCFNVICLFYCLIFTCCNFYPSFSIYLTSPPTCNLSLSSPTQLDIMPLFQKC